MKTTEIKEVINASAEKIWDVLFTQYGDIHIHNPNMQSSNYVSKDTTGALNCVRHCQFDDKLSLQEKITDFDVNKRMKLEVTGNNLPFVKDISATYELSTLGNGKTELKMTSHTSTSPGFMIHLMAGTLKKGLLHHLFGMKYYIETGKVVTKENYSEVFKNYMM